MPVTAGIGCSISVANKVLHKVIMNKYIKYKKLKEKAQQTIKPFDKLLKKSLQDNVIDKNEKMKVHVSLTKYLDETKCDFS